MGQGILYCFSPSRSLSLGSLFYPETINKFDAGINLGKGNKMEIENQKNENINQVAPKMNINKNIGSKEQHSKDMDKQFMRELIFVFQGKKTS